MEGSIDLKFTYTEKEYAKAFKQYFLSSLRIRIDLGLSIVAIILGGYVWISGDQAVYGGGFMAMGALLLMVMLHILFISPKKVFRQNPKFSDEYLLSFHNDGVGFKTVHISSDLAWNHYVKISENKDFFYLVYGKTMFTIIPKRVFRNKEDENRFRELLTEKVKKS